MGAARIFAVEDFDRDNRFETSWILPPYVLAGIRGLISLYIFVSIIYNLSWSSINNPIRVARHWSYFTNITHWSLGFYFLFSAFHTFMYARSGSAPLNKWPKVLQYLHSLLFSTITVYPIVVTIAYWGILADTATFGTRFSTWSNITTHALNSVYAAFEIIMTRTERPPWVNIAFIFMLIGLYIGSAYITHEDQGFYPYEVLDPKKNGIRSTLGYVFGILIGAVVLFVIVWLLIWLRMWLTEAVLGFEGKLHPRRRVEKKSPGEIPLGEMSNASSPV